MSGQHKRTAPQTPNGRPQKRQATSSPEEGELDDGVSVTLDDSRFSANGSASRDALSPFMGKPTGSNMNSAAVSGSTSLPSSSVKSGTKVPFPFKKAATKPVESGKIGGPQPGVYSRPDEDDRRFRGGGDDGRIVHPLPLPPHRRRDDKPDSGGRWGGGDRWVPSADRYVPAPPNDRPTRGAPVLLREREREPVPSNWDSYRPSYQDDRRRDRSWERDRERGRSRSRSRSRDRDYPHLSPLPRDNARTPPGPPPSRPPPHPAQTRHSRSPTTRSPSPDPSRTRSRTRTPSRTPPPTRKEKHRLPTPHATQSAFSPLSIPRRYDLDDRDFYRERDRRDQYQRDHDGNDSDDWGNRHYRPSQPQSLSSYMPRSPPPPSASVYKVTSPQGQSLTQPVSQPRSPVLRPRSPSPAPEQHAPESPARLDAARTPPGPPPPLPPPDVRLLHNQNSNTSFSGLTGSRPSAPGAKKARTPPNVNAPRVTDVKEVEMGEVEVEAGEVEDEKLPTGVPSLVAPSTSTVAPTTTMATSAEKSTKNGKRMRTPVKRTREQEKSAYGRVFIGCGKKDDYDVMTKLGEGTFGEVHKALHKRTKNLVALKRILMHNEREGMPVTALREIKILKALKHPCVVELLDLFVVPSKGKSQPMSVYMVFPYMDHDLAGLLENERVQLSPSQIKLYMKQLLEGTEYMHHNKILHRDMKAANLLISNSGSLQIADFGLARSFDPNPSSKPLRPHTKPKPDRKYTNCVVTRWYRPPELLLGARSYGGEVDMWGIGCVLGEMFHRRPILPGTSDLDQLEKIWQLCGAPNQQNWPDWDKLPGCEGKTRFLARERRVRQVYDTIGKETVDLLDKLLTLDPRERITASQALDHEYFWSDPLPADPKTLPHYESSHEFDQRGRRHANMAQAQQGQQQNPPPTNANPGQGPPRQHHQQGGNRNVKYPPAHSRNPRPSGPPAAPASHQSHQQAPQAQPAPPPMQMQMGMGMQMNMQPAMAPPPHMNINAPPPHPYVAGPPPGYPMQPGPPPQMMAIPPHGGGYGAPPPQMGMGVGMPPMGYAGAPPPPGSAGWGAPAPHGWQQGPPPPGYGGGFIGGPPGPGPGMAMGPPPPGYGYGGGGGGGGGRRHGHGRGRDRERDGGRHGGRQGQEQGGGRGSQGQSQLPPLPAGLPSRPSVTGLPSRGGSGGGSGGGGGGRQGGPGRQLEPGEDGSAGLNYG